MPSKHLVGAAELLAGVDAPVLPPEPLPVDEMGAGEVAFDAVRSSRSMASR